jgi:hypothetical protein
MSELEAIARELEEAAARLRADDVGSDEAAELVERCAELATRAGQELEREARATPAGDQPGQETLL